MAVSPFRIAQGGMKNLPNIFFFQSLELKNRAAGEQGLIDFKKWIFCGRPDQNDRPIFHTGQESILLGFIKAMNFINKEENFPLRGEQWISSIFNHASDIGDPRGDGIKTLEAAFGSIGNNPCQRTFAAARRAEKDDGTELIGKNHAPQHFSFPKQLTLAEKFGQRPGCHSIGKRFFFSGNLSHCD